MEPPEVAKMRTTVQLWWKFRQDEDIFVCAAYQDENIFVPSGARMMFQFWSKRYLHHAVLFEIY